MPANIAISKRSVTKTLRVYREPSETAPFADKTFQLLYAAAPDMGGDHTDDNELLIALRHPLRRQILRAMAATDPPDLILFTGDFVDAMVDPRGAMLNLERFARGLKAKFGVCAIPGNHDWFDGLDGFARLCQAPCNFEETTNDPLHPEAHNDNLTHVLAWAGAFVVTVFVLLLSVLSRAILLRNKVPND